MNARPTIIHLILLLWIVLFLIQPAGTASAWAMQQDATFSADFDNISISQALSELSRMSRIKIVTSTPVENKIKKSFRNETVDDIIRELLNGFNYASLWSVGDHRVDSITIWLFEKTANRVTDPNMPPVEPNPPPSTFLPPPADRPPVPGRPNRQGQAEERSSQGAGGPDAEPKSPEGSGNTPGKEVSKAGQEEGNDQSIQSAGAVEVQGLVDSSQAQQLDLQKGDIILEYGGIKIGRAADLVMESKKKTPEEEVDILVLRDGVPVRISAKGGYIGVRIKTVNTPTETQRR